MITKQLLDVLASIARLTEAEQKHLIATLQGLPIATGEPLSVTVFEARGRKRKPPFVWTKEYTAMARRAAEDSTIQSGRQRKKSLEAIAISIGTDVKVVQRKVDSIRRSNKK